MAVKPIPDGYHSVTPYLVVEDAAKAIDYYTKAFGARETFRMNGPDGKVGHAEIQIGNSMLMLADPNPNWGAKSAKEFGGSPVSLMVYVEDCDGVFKRAIAAGAQEVKAVEDQFYGDRSGTLTDPFGLTWTVSTHKEDISPEEMNRRAEEYMKKTQAPA
jgi:PhnB protein